MFQKIKTGTWIRPRYVFSMDKKREIIDKLIGKIYPVSEEGKQKLSDILVCFHLEKGESFLREGQVCKYIGFVEQGMVRQFYNKGNRDLTEHFTYENGVFICLESFFKQIPSYLQVEVLETSVVYALPHDDFMRLVRESQEIHFLYSGILENCLIISQQKADASRFETAQERYNRLLSEHPQVVKRVPLIYIASYLGMTPETLSRVRAGV